MILIRVLCLPKALRPKVDKLNSCVQEEYINSCVHVSAQLPKVPRPLNRMLPSCLFMKLLVSSLRVNASLFSHHISFRVTMSVPYERYNDDIEAAEQSSLSSEEGAGATPTARPDVVILQRNRRRQEIFRDRWPKRIGIVQLAVGFICSMIGKFGK